MECAKVCLSDSPQCRAGSTCSISLQVLQSVGATAISIFVTHPVFPQQSWRKFTAGQSPVEFAHIWVTDSLPQARELADHPPFTVLSLCDILADSLLGYDLLSRNI